MLRLDGKRALITGGGTGIGFAIADVFARQGARVALSGRRSDVLQRAVLRLEANHGSGCAIYVQGDVSKVESARAMVAHCIAKLGGIELLVNSAGSVDRAASLDSTIEAWDAIFDLNVRGTFITCQEAIRWMVHHGGGSIVNISSTASEKAYSPAASYGPSKAAVNNMSYNMAVEYGPQQVRVNTILPALIETELAHTRVKPGEDWYEDYEKPATAGYPLGRIGQPTDVANAALFLASDEASWITGISLRVDGGSAMKMGGSPTAAAQPKL